MIRGIVLIVLFLAVINETAYAYIDPGSGSYMFQLIMGFLLGLIFTVKNYWRSNIKEIFKKYFLKRK